MEETLQWNALVFWVGDKAVGGKMFAVRDPEPKASHVMSFAVPRETYHDLLEREGVSPAPYLARAHWVALEHWNALPEADLRAHLRAAHQRVETALPRKTRRVLDAPDREYRAAVREQRALRRASAKKA